MRNVMFTRSACALLHACVFVLGAMLSAPVAAEEAKATETAELSAELSTATPAETSSVTAAASSTQAPLEVRDLDQRVNRLKDDVYRLKSRLALLAESVMEGALSGARAVVTFENKLSPSFRVTRVTVSLDARTVFDRADETGRLGEVPAFEVFNGNLDPGNHAIAIQLELAGQGYGVFAYMQGYRFKVRSSHDFESPDGKTLNLKVVAYEEGRATKPMRERPALRFAERLSTLRAEGKE